MNPKYIEITFEMVDPGIISVLERKLTSGDVAALTTHGELLIPDIRDFELTGFSRVFDSRLKTLCIMAFLTSDKMDMETRHSKICQFVETSQFPQIIKQQILGAVP